MEGKQILVVDDEALVLESIRLTVVHYGYPAATASSGSAALEMLETASYPLVITDRKMPGMTGDQLASAIKSRWPSVAIIMLTGFPPDHKPASVDVVLLKPFSTADLRSAIERLIGAPSS